MQPGVDAQNEASPEPCVRAMVPAGIEGSDDTRTVRQDLRLQRRQNLALRRRHVDLQALQRPASSRCSSTTPAARRDLLDQASVIALVPARPTICCAPRAACAIAAASQRDDGQTAPTSPGLASATIMNAALRMAGS
jgi:hypothetical protein